MASDFERRLNRRATSPHSLSNDRDRERVSPGPATSLTHADIAQAMLDSPDEGGTLDFSHKNLGDVGESGAEELATIGRDDPDDECTVLRVALGYNRLATLPMAFALLARLRYLNLRANNFTIFPDVLTVMPSLEVLDLSRNKLKRLPSQPGTLLSLRVFSIAKNKLTRLPSYISKASKLTVFQVAHNPLDWPPKYVMDPLDNAEDADTMVTCIENVKRWIEDQGSGPSTERAKGSEVPRRPSDESTSKFQPSRSLDSDLTSDDSDTYTNLSLPGEGLSAITQHSRSFSTESDVSNYSAVSQESSESDAPFFREQDTEPLKLPPPLHLSNITSTSLTSSPSVSPTVSLLENPPLATIDDYMPTIHHPKAQPFILGNDMPQLHGRNASYSVAREPSPLSKQLSSKKSLPDLRGANATVTERTRNHMQRPRIPNMPSTRLPTANFEGDTWKTDSQTDLALLTDGDESLSYHGPSGSHSTQPLAPSHSRTPRSQPANNHHRGAVAATAEPMPSPSMSSPQGPAPSMDVERNSYFRRLSTLPPSTISSTIPESLLAMIDSVRGILFAVSQIYQSLRHYTVFAIDERLSGLLGKVLDPASTYMTHLINALDRFDSVSRRGIPPPAVCRGVLESCRDNVAVFGKVVGVLHLQLKVLAGSDDARYSRSLLLMLYGSMGEISNSWQTMAPHLEAIQPLLYEHRPPPPVALSSKAHSLSASLTSSSSRSGISPIMERPPPVPSPISRTSTSHTNGTNGRSRMARRHAGSFSTRDVQIGKALPSTVEEPSLPSLPALPSAPSPSTVHPLRSALRRPTHPSQMGPVHSSQPSTVESPSTSTHSRQGSSSPARPSGSSPYPSSHTQDVSIPRVANSLEVPSDSSKMVDEDLLDTMEAATETARSVWRMMYEILYDTKETSLELLESLEQAQDITRRLKERIQAMRSGTADGYRKAFWEDAHLFVKAVVNVSTILKAFSVSHPFSTILRSNIAKLTQSTQDFAILLQVSSFSPAPTPGPYSSAIPALPSTPGRPSPSHGGLSRSRSAQPPSSVKPKSGDLKEVPWSALPHQTFKIHPNP